MSGARKLQTEIDRTLKKVEEGVELFDETWEKVYSATQQNQKEKYEVDLKKEIKKLQRLRDQIKTWISSNDTKDKRQLMDARKLIETKMEQFKVCEKETKTKTYSKEGLAREARLDPAEQQKQDCHSYLQDCIARLEVQIEATEADVEKLSSGKGKNKNKAELEEKDTTIRKHRWHISKMEQIIRMLDNDVLEVERIEEVKEDIEYYIDSNQDPEFMASYEDMDPYEVLELEEIPAPVVELLPTVKSSRNKKNSGDDDEKDEKKKKKDKKDKKALSSAIPITIGRAKVQSQVQSKSKDVKPEVVPAKAPTPAVVNAKPPPVVAVAPTSRVNSRGGDTMANILLKDQHREQPKDHKDTKQQQVQQQQQRLRVHAVEDKHKKPTGLTGVHGAVDIIQEKRQAVQPSMPPMPPQQPQAMQPQTSAQSQVQRDHTPPPPVLHQVGSVSQTLQSSASLQTTTLIQPQMLQQTAMSQQAISVPQQGLPQVDRGGAHQRDDLSAEAVADMLNHTSSATTPSVSHTSGLSGSGHTAGVGHGVDTLFASDKAVADANGSHSMQGDDALLSTLQDLNESMATIPTAHDRERQKLYCPRNPYNTPSVYYNAPGPSPVFDDPSMYEHLHTDTLFFIFYYMQGSYQQFLAARELKKQSWRFHKKYKTWFQRHEEPKITTDEYEQGTYVYFDYQGSYEPKSGWCQRIKYEFTFEYEYLEDELVV